MVDALGLWGHEVELGRRSLGSEGTGPERHLSVRNRLSDPNPNPLTLSQTVTLSHHRAGSDAREDFSDSGSKGAPHTS